MFPVKAAEGKGRPPYLASVAKVSDRKEFDRTRVKILTPK